MNMTATFPSNILKSGTAHHQVGVGKFHQETVDSMRRRAPHSDPNIVRTKRIVRIQALYRGNKVRAQVRVCSLEPGLVSVHICASPELLVRMGFADAPSKGAPSEPNQTITYLAVDEKRFSSTVRTREGLLNPVDLAEISQEGHADKRTRVYTNGGYFNHHHFTSKSCPEHVPIGPVVSGGRASEHLEIPLPYREDYVEIRFRDGSLLYSAPQLSVAGQSVFTEEKVRKARPRYSIAPDFSFETSCILPGHLNHAADRNPRAAISRGASETIRLAVGLAKERGHGAKSGFTLPAWANIMARLDRMSTPPNSSVNLDGGSSAALVVAQRGGAIHRSSQVPAGKDVANVIELTSKT